MAHRHGALFILDEMRSGFRLALGGAQEYFGVKADLVTLGKGMSNGHPLSAVVGRSDVLRGLGRTHMESTYFWNSAEMAAAIATIELLRSTDTIEIIWQRGEQFLTGLRRLSNSFDVDVEVAGLPPTPFMHFTDPDPQRQALAPQSFFVETMRNGVFLLPDHHWFVSAAHTESEIDQTLDVCRLGFAAAERAMRDVMLA